MSLGSGYGFGREALGIADEGCDRTLPEVQRVQASSKNRACRVLPSTDSYSVSLHILLRNDLRTHSILRLEKQPHSAEQHVATFSQERIPKSFQHPRGLNNLDTSCILENPINKSFSSPEPHCRHVWEIFVDPYCKKKTRVHVKSQIRSLYTIETPNVPMQQCPLRICSSFNYHD